MLAQSACFAGGTRLRRRPRPLAPATVLACLAALAAAGGCRHDGAAGVDGLAEHILPPLAAVEAGPDAAPSPSTLWVPKILSAGRLDAKWAR